MAWEAVDRSNLSRANPLSPAFFRPASSV